MKIEDKPLLAFHTLEHLLDCLLAIYAGRLYQQDGYNVIDILLFPLDKGHVPENLW